ncbi:MAG: lysophospholipid acyltransferase family protein [bacterium]
MYPTCFVAVKRAVFRVLQWLVRLYFRLLFRVEVRGVENIPRRGRVLIASNHVSGYDPPLVGCVIPRVVYFLGKKELFEIPGLAQLIRFCNCIPVDRTDFAAATLKQIEGVLKNDEALMLFPEGTRTLTGRPLRWKAGLGMIAARTGADIVPACIENLFGVRGSILTRPHVRITFGAALPVAPFLANQAQGKELYAQIATAAHARLMELIQQPELPA